MLKNMLLINPTMSMITLNVSDLNLPFKNRDCQNGGWKRKQDPTMLSTSQKKTCFNIKTQVKSKGMEKDITC